MIPATRRGRNRRSLITRVPASAISYSPKKTSFRPPSSTAKTFPRDCAAKACSNETAAIGFTKTSASALTTASPMRNPVNDPGPEAVANPPISPLPNPCFSSKAAICGTSSAENVPPTSGATSKTSQESSGPHCASAMLPSLPEVSTARRIMIEIGNCRSVPARKHRWPLQAASTNSSSTPPALDGCTKTYRCPPAPTLISFETSLTPSFLRRSTAAVKSGTRRQT